MYLVELQVKMRKHSLKLLNKQTYKKKTWNKCKCSFKDAQSSYNRIRHSEKEHQSIILAQINTFINPMA